MFGEKKETKENKSETESYKKWYNFYYFGSQMGQTSTVFSQMLWSAAYLKFCQ